MISGHTEPVSGNSMPSLSPVTPETYAIRETILTKYYHVYGQRVGWVIRYPIHSAPLGSSKSMRVTSLLKLRSRYETDCIMVISCEGDFSLVLLAMFIHPIQLWCSRIPTPYSHFGKPIVWSGKLELFLLFRQTYPLRIWDRK